MPEVTSAWSGSTLICFCFEIGGSQCPEQTLSTFRELFMQQTLYTSALRDGQFKLCQPHYVAKRVLMGLKSSYMSKQISEIKQGENIV